MKEFNLHCSDGVLAAAIAEHSEKGWTIYGISKVYGFGDAEYKKVLFDTLFDEIIAFNSMSGVSYVAVKKNGLWGLIRFRLNPESAVHKESYRKALGSEPIDEKAMDPIGREIKMIEDIKYTNIEKFKTKYKLDDYCEDSFQDTEQEDYTQIEENKSGWSDELKEYTEDLLSNLTFGVNPRTNNVSMKRDDGSFGYIELSNALSNKYIVVSEDGNIEHFQTVNDLIDAGWAID